MALRSLAALDAFRAATLPTGYLTSVRALYAPMDDVHGALLALINSATKSLSIGMYALTDRLLADAVKAKLANPKVTVQLTLDKGEAAMTSEAALLAAESFPASSIAIGDSEHGSLMHLKQMVVDGWDTVTGSTNWTSSGEYAQDNALFVVRSRVLAAEAQARLAAIHTHMLQVAATTKGASGDPVRA